MFTLSRSTARLLVIVPFAALLVAACEHNLGLGPTPPGPLATITVTPNPRTLAISAIQPFVATGRDAAGNLVSITPTWSVVAPAAGTINSSSGLFTAGTTPATYANTIRATVGSIFGSATVTVTAPGTLVAITVTPNPGSAVTGGTIQFTAAGQDATGAAITISPAATWSVVAGGGTISSTGLFTAGATTGTFPNTVRATSGGISGFATAIVTAAISLGAAATHGILAGSAITCADRASPYSTIHADVSLSPGTLSSITGFGNPPLAECIITGLRSAEDSPDPTYAQTAQAALLTAYNQVGAMTCDSTIAALPSGTTLAPGVYCSGSTIDQTGTLTLNGGGNQNAIFVFKAGSSLTTAGSVILLLSGGAQAKNVYWWNGISATLGVGSAWQGNVLAQSSITLEGTVTLCGRALARTGAVNLNGDNDIIRLPPVAAATCTFP